MRYLKLFSAAILGTQLTVGATFAADVKIEERVVGPAYEQGVTYVLSPKGLHLATVHPKGSRFAVTVDGVQGPPFDEIIKSALNDLRHGLAMNLNEAPGYVAFSPDGTRYAYAARSGKELVVIADGKEIYRAPVPASEGGLPPLLDQQIRYLMFSPDGKKVMFVVPAPDAAKEQVFDPREGVQLPRSLAVRLMIDGKPASPPFTPVVMHLPRFNADGSRWALLGGRPGNASTGFLIVDGKDAGDLGAWGEWGHELAQDGNRPFHFYRGLPQFTPDGKRLVALRHNPKEMTQDLLVDGKPILTSKRIYFYVVTSLGDIAALAVDRDGKRRLFVNGKPVAGTDHAYDAVFSPDGKRWAAACAELNDIALGNSAGAQAGIHANGAWVIVDGKKELEYAKVSDLAFTPDSSRCVYVGEAAPTGGVGKKFVVINGEEDNGHQNLRVKPVFSKNGNRVTYVGEVMGGQVRTYLDGKPLPPTQNAHNLTLSPDGSRFAYYAAESSLGSSLMLDGESKARGGGFGGSVLFSDDSKHIASIASPPKGGGQAVFVDGEFLPIPKTLQGVQPLAFTADNRNLLISGMENGPDGRPARTYYINGTRVAQFSQMAVSSFGSHPGNPSQPPPWELQPDGSVLFIGAEPVGMFGGQLKVVKLTLPPETNIAAWISEVKAKAEAEAKPKPQTRPSRTPPASTPEAPPPRSDASPSLPQPSATPAAPARSLTWADLVGHPERWPEKTKMTVQLRFDGGILKEGTEVRIEEVMPNKVRLISPQDFTFVVDPKDCDLLAAANAQWAKLTPEQQAITPETLAADSTLWPGKVKVLETQNFGGMQVKAGVELPVTGMKKNEVLLQHPQSKDHLLFPFRYTDVFARARQLVLLPPELRPGRMADLLEEATLDLDGKRAKLEKAHYYVFYFSASTCPRCEVFTPKLVAHYKKSLADRKDVMFISWPTEASTAPYLPYARKNGITWTVMPVERKAGIGNYGLMEIPGILVLDRFGTILLATNKIKGAPMEAAETALTQLNGVLKPVSMEFVSAKIPETASQPETPPTTEVKPTTEAPAAQQPVEMKWLDCDKIIADCMTQSRDAKGVVRTSINKTVFDNKYRGLHIKFSGTVDAVKKPEGIVIFKGTGRWPTNYHVRATFPPDKLAELDKLAKGRTVTLEADIADFSLPDMDVAVMGMGPSRIILLKNIKLEGE